MSRRSNCRPLSLVGSVVAVGTVMTLVAACGENGGDPQDAGPPDATPVGFATYDPWMVMDSSELAPVRGFTVRRGIIHCHSPYSHDACDGIPRIDGERNEQCFNDVRYGMCVTGQDFVFMTDHDDLFAYYDYPEVLLYAEGDELIMRGGLPVANRINCGDGRSVILSAGTETDMMPIGLEHHVGDTEAERVDAYNTTSATAIYALQDAGALVFLQHTEGWDATDVLTLPIDGIEIYNLHFNMMDNLAQVATLALDLLFSPETLGEPEIGLLAVFQENEEDLAHWSRLVMQRRIVGAVASDVHQNVASDVLADGDRLDSFRRIMRWFSNYVLLPDGPVDDLVIKQAVAAGRMYGVFDYLGFPNGFDFRAEAGSDVYEMGDQVPVGESATLFVEMPEIWRLHPYGPQPLITARILKANHGEWIEVASGDSSLSYDADPGAYRAEIRMVPEHLRPWCGPRGDDWIVERPWIYSNVIYVNTDFE